MKKIFLAGLFALLPVLLCAQAQLETKKFKISDICERTLDIVLTGDKVLDAVFREQMPNIWNISPYEFCTREQFEARKRSEEYYFLVITYPLSSRHEETGIKSITLFKGDPDAKEGTNGLYRITTVPFCSAQDSNGREAAFLPALVDIVQQQVLSILDKEFNIGDMVRVKASNKLSTWKKPVLIAGSDIAVPLKENMKGRNLIIADEDVIDACMREGDPRYLVAYSVVPSVVSRDAFCFTMVIDVQTHELYYFRRRKAGASAAAGFMMDDIKAILSHIKR